MTINVNDCFFYIKNGANIKQGVISGGIPITRIETLANDTFNRDKMGYAGIHDKKKYTEYILQDGDILMSHINSMAYLGRAVMYKMQKNECIIHGMNLLRLKANRNFILPEYAEYYFKSNTFKKYIKKIAKKSVNQASFSIADLKSIPLFLPNMVEQKKIYNTLNRIDNIISLKNQQLKKLDLLTKSLFVEMFGDFVENPKCYKKEPIETHVDLLSGYPFKSSQYVDVGINICGGLIIMPQTIKWEDCLHWESTDGYEEYMLQENDIVMALDRPWISDGFKIAKVDAEHLPALLIQRTARIRAIDINQEYLYYCFIIGGFERHSSITGSLVPHISLKDIRSFQILIPPLKLQEQFADIVGKIDKHKSVIQKSLDETQLLFDSLMQKYFG